MASAWNSAMRSVYPQGSPAPQGGPGVFGGLASALGSLGNALGPAARRYGAPTQPGIAASAAKPAAPAAPDYMSQYQTSLAQSRASINQQLQAALADINGNEMRAGAAINQLPGQYQQAYGAANNALGGFAQSLNAHQQAGGAGSQTGYSADWLAPEKAAMGNSLTFLQQQVPDLQLARQSEYADRRGQANQYAADAQTALDSNQRDALLAQQQQQSGYAHDVQMEKMRERAALGPSAQVGSAEWWADQKQSHPLKANAMEARAGQVGFLQDLQRMAPRDRAEYMANVGKQSPRLASMLQYEMAVAGQAQAKSKKKTSKNALG